MARLLASLFRLRRPRAILGRFRFTRRDPMQYRSSGSGALRAGIGFLGMALFFALLTRLDLLALLNAAAGVVFLGVAALRRLRGV